MFQPGSSKYMAGDRWTCPTFALGSPQLLSWVLAWPPLSALEVRTPL